MSFLDELKETEAAAIQSNNIPEGDYIAEVDQVRIDKTKQPQGVSLQLRIVKGDQKNRVVFKNYRMNKEGYPWFLKDCTTLEINPKLCKSEDEFDQLVQSVAGKIVEIHVKNKEYNGKIYDNAYINCIAPDVALDVDRKEELPF